MIERKTRDVTDPYEIWYRPDINWAWAILKGYQKPNNIGTSQYDRVFCAVSSDTTREQMGSGYELGDAYVNEVRDGHLVWVDGAWATGSLGMATEKKAEILSWFNIK